MLQRNGFTVLELMIALAIAGVLATLAFANYGDHIQRSNFKTMREVSTKFALSQQEHRQRFGRYAESVSAEGTTTAERLIFNDVSNYTIAIEVADFRNFTATITPNSDLRKTPDACKSIRVSSSQGYLVYSSLNKSRGDSTKECMPNG